ncbi:MAG: CRTAC1 family protein, partial [Planctomycetes bacterium]|nr:CRTAC1 family protein [Planctomycetota bacterium]
LDDDTPLTLANPANSIDLRDFPLPGPLSGLAAGNSKPADPSSAVSIAFRDDAANVGLSFQYFNSGSRPGNGQKMYEFNGGGCAVLDYDGDGLPDLYLTQGCRWPVMPDQREHLDRLFRNLGNGKFRDVTAEAGLQENRFSLGVAVGDFDNDGFDDLYVSNIGRNRLYRNRGDGTFHDVTERAGVGDPRWSTSCLMADLNGDGLPDLYSTNYLQGHDVFTRVCRHKDGNPRMCMPFNFDASPDQLFLNQGNGRFENVTEKCGIAAPNGEGLGVVAADWTGDGKLSVFVANDVVANFFFVNHTKDAGGPPRFFEQAVVAGLAYNRDGRAEGCMGIAAGDIDGNGTVDLFVTNFYRESNTLYRLTAPLAFEDLTREAGLALSGTPMLGFGAQFLDADLDGRADLILTNGHVDDYRNYARPYRMPAQFHRNLGGGRFQELSAKKLGPFFAKKHLGRGLALIDWNRDGREDVVISHLDAPVALLTNITTETGHFLAVRLRGVRCSRDAIGTAVTVETVSGRQVRQLTAGGGYQASNERRLVFGLGKDDRVRKLTIRWPSGTVQQYDDLTADRELTFVENVQRAFSSPK